MQPPRAPHTRPRLVRSDHAPDMPNRVPDFPEAVPAVRGVYCLREPINGLWAYYAMTSKGELLHEPRPAELGEDTAFVVTALFEELDLLDPVVEPAIERSHLTLIRCSASSSSGAA